MPSGHAPMRGGVRPETFSLVGGDLEVAVASDVGGRYENQDSWLVDENLDLLVLADGLGGLPNGAQASKLACESMQFNIAEGESLDDAIYASNIALDLQSKAEKLPRSMGSTVVALKWMGDQFHLGWVGDSFAMGVWQGRARSLTRDHSQVLTMVTSGEITAAAARTHPLRNLITQALGPTSSLHLSPGLNTGRMRHHERVLLATDGFLEVMSPSELAGIIWADESVEQVVRELMWLAHARGVTDNITALLGIWRGDDVEDEERMQNIGIWSTE